VDQFKSFQDKIFSLRPEGFTEMALEVFRWQVRQNPIYHSFVQALGVSPAAIDTLEAIPFLPVDFFKTHRVATGVWQEEEIFTSSGTTGQITSRHFVRDREFYLKVARRAFENFYGPLTNFHVLALLPAYLERPGSSLVAMADDFIKRSESEHSGFYLYNHQELVEKLESIKSGTRKVLLLGVTFALLDLAEKFPLTLGEQVVVMETGGMKGRRREMVREEVHAILTTRLGVSKTHSEYGMTELMSQAYSSGEGVFSCPPWMRILLRDANDPLEKGNHITSGGINVIDLANLASCCFLEVADLARMTNPVTFEVLGRFDNTDVRGCNLMVT
jgi:hypothetical protein